MDLEISTMAVAPLGCNCSILRDPASGDTIVVDPGGDADRIVSILEEKNCRVKYIVHTHAHFDHMLGTHDVAEACSAKGPRPEVCLHPADNALYRMLPQQCGWFGLPPHQPEEKITHALADEEQFVLGHRRFEVLFTPGHTQGSCCFHLPEQGILFSGDTLFASSIGRTDLPGGDFTQIIKSIKNRLMTLDDGTVVIPGHGELTRIFEERRTNPFL